MVTFYSLSQKAVESSGEDKKITWTTIKNSTGDLLFKLSSMKFQDPKTGEAAVVANLKALYEEIQQAFRNLLDQ